MLSDAYYLSSSYHRHVYRTCSIVLILLTTALSVTSTTNASENIGLAIRVMSYTALVMTGILNKIDPAQKSYDAHQVALEFGEIAQDIEIFTNTDRKNGDQIREQLHITSELLNVWKGQAPPIAQRFITVVTRASQGQRIRTAQKEEAMQSIR